jgi:hypothetical protein
MLKKRCRILPAGGLGVSPSSKKSPKTGGFRGLIETISASLLHPQQVGVLAMTAPFHITSHDISDYLPLISLYHIAVTNVLCDE